VDEQVSLAGIPKPKVFIMETDSPNAFATGRSKKHATIAVTTGIQGILNEEELGAVIAHELGHVGNRDTLIMTMVAAIATAIGLIAMIARFSMFFGGMGGRGRGGGGSAAGIIGLLVIAIVMPLAALLVRSAISRAREFQADATGAATSGRPLALSTALQKLERGSEAQHIDNISQERLEPVSHMFIVNPLKANTMSRLFSTHPPVAERVRRLEAIANPPLWSDR
jgi:heat shock protein HtpX